MQNFMILKERKDALLRSSELRSSQNKFKMVDTAYDGKHLNQDLLSLRQSDPFELKNPKFEDFLENQENKGDSLNRQPIDSRHQSESQESFGSPFTSSNKNNQNSLIKVESTIRQGGKL